MSDSETKPDLNQLIQNAHQGVVEQQAATAAIAKQLPRQSNTKNMLACVLLLGLIVVAFLQYPRIHAPYVWPDAASSPMAAEADMEAVMGVIEAYRWSRGSFPANLGQVQFPAGLAPMLDGSKLDYSPSDKAYSLTWMRPNWIATYSGETGKISVQPQAK